MGAAQAIGASIDAYDQYKRFLDKGDDEYVQHLEEGSRFWIRLAKTTVNPRLKAPSTKVKNVNPKERLHADLVSVGDLSLPFSELDEDFPEGYDGIDELTKVVKAAIFAHGKKLKMGEGDTGFFSSIEVGRQAAQHELGKILPPSPNNWTDFASDEACSRLAFYAIGQLHLTGIVDSDKTVCQLPEETVCKVDLAFLHKYSTRTGFERYGCIAYFSVTKKLLGIYWCSGNRLVQPGHSDWEHVKYVYRSSLMAGVTIWDHLVNVHWIISNNVVYAIRENLSANHSLRRLLKPHTFETVSINRASQFTLLPIKGLAYRVFAFDESSWFDAYYDLLSSFKYESYEEHIATKKLPKDIEKTLPIVEDGLPLWNCIRKYVENYLSVWYKNDEDVLKDLEIQSYWHYYGFLPCIGKPYGLPALSLNALIDQVTHSIFWVTGGHELVGGVQEYLSQPDGLCAKIISGKAETDVETFFLGLTLMALTGLRKPKLMDSWAHIHVYNGMPADKKSAVLKVLDEFQQDLKLLADENDKKNGSGARPVIFQQFNPKFLECSVSI